MRVSISREIRGSDARVGRTTDGPALGLTSRRPPPLLHHLLLSTLFSTSSLFSSIPYYPPHTRRKFRVGDSLRALLPSPPTNHRLHQGPPFSTLPQPLFFTSTFLPFSPLNIILRPLITPSFVQTLLRFYRGPQEWHRFFQIGASFIIRIILFGEKNPDRVRQAGVHRRRLTLNEFQEARSVILVEFFPRQDTLSFSLALWRPHLVSSLSELGSRFHWSSLTLRGSLALFLSSILFPLYWANGYPLPVGFMGGGGRGLFLPAVRLLMHYYRETARVSMILYALSERIIHCGSFHPTPPPNFNDSWYCADAPILLPEHRHSLNLDGCKMMHLYLPLASGICKYV